jgi:hypothetical protein
MSRCAYFVSAPTVRFLETLARFASVAPPLRRKIAANVLIAIKPLLGSSCLEQLGAAARRYQDERWRLIASDIRDVSDPRFAAVLLTEQWILAQRELLRGGAPVSEVLADKRRAALERFIMDTVSPDSFEVVELHPEEARRRAAEQDAAAA